MAVVAMISMTVLAEDEKSIVEREYWFDNDVANSKTLGESVATVEMSGLNQGLHAFTMRVKNDAGVWSSTMTKYFLVPADAFMENGLAVSHYMYWIEYD